MNPKLDVEKAEQALALFADKRIPEGPWFCGFDRAYDAPDHRDSGLALVDTGRSSDHTIARLCEWPTAQAISVLPDLAAQLAAALAILKPILEACPDQDEILGVVVVCDVCHGAHEGGMPIPCRRCATMGKRVIEVGKT